MKRTFSSKSRRSLRSRISEDEDLHNGHDDDEDGDDDHDDDDADVTDDIQGQEVSVKVEKLGEHVEPAFSG